MKTKDIKIGGRYEAKVSGKVQVVRITAMREVFSGLMAPLISRSIPDLQPSFVEFAAALKQRVENGAA